MTKQSYRRLLIILAIIICLLIIFIALLLTHPKIETKTIEVLKEVPVEITKEIFVEVPKEIIVEVEKEIIVEVEVEKEPTYVYQISSEEREMLARLVYLESNIESIECQKAIASVVINRWQHGDFGDTLADVIYAPGQFSPASKIEYTTPNNTNYEAVDYVLKNGCTLPAYVLFFRSRQHFEWDGYVPYQIIDHTYFGYLEKDKT